MSILLVAIALLLIALGLPLMFRRVPPNELYGLRVEATSRSTRTWYEANAASGRDFVIFGAIMMLLAISRLLIPSIPAMAYTFVNITALLAGSIIVALIGWKRANRIAKNELH